MMQTTLTSQRLIQKINKSHLVTVTSRCISSTTVTSASASAPVVPRILDRRTDETGPGGRGSDAGLKVCVFGASGFLGRYVCSHLGTNGFMTYIANRGDDLEMRFLKPMFELGRSRFNFYSPRDRDSIAETIADADLVINMTGKYYETKHLIEQDSFPFLKYTTNYTFQESNVDFPKVIAELCTELQVDNLIHVSSLNASPDSKSEWARTKYAGEMAVKEAYPWATIVRPSQLFGNEDRLLNWFATSVNTLPFIPMIEGGDALTQPVYAVNVADTIQKIVDAPEKFEGRTVDCFGNQDYSYRELAQFVYDITGQEPKLVDVPKDATKMVAKGLDLMGKPILTPDMVELWSEDFIPSMTQEEYDAQPIKDKIYTMKDLDVEAAPMEKIAFNYLHRFRVGGHFSLTKGYH